ncbi:isocitrate/isopropylmalate family dehydrogenase [Cedecea davisae]|uniref:isocitrate/isopropylmalate family dehydrogenase n=1 Tax=Cedecea davisae TaxID=158484 RepID=UPI00242DF336|nr:isocitrate/isopropylmalate family dehydrogenase [Cedecea davisae]
MKKVLILPGDGIGQEVCEAALPVISALDLPIMLSWGEIGWECWKTQGDPVPARTWDEIQQVDAILLGAITSKGKAEAERALPSHLQGKNRAYLSPVIQLRQRLGLFANIRPVQYIEGDRRPFRCCVIRENTEGLYSGLDFKGVSAEASGWLKHPNIDQYSPEEAAWTVRLQTRFGLERLFYTAFDYARQHQFGRVTFADKPNVMRESGQFAAEIFYEVAAQFSDIAADIQNVDAVALRLVLKPDEYGVIVAENMFGDILSDLAAGIMGGLGLAPSANVGSHIPYFEPVHGSAPGMAGKGKANPAAMFYSIALMLEYLGFDRQAEAINRAVDRVIQEGKTTTYDLGGTATTQQMANAIIRAIIAPVAMRSASVITIGDELLSGQYQNTNQQHLSQLLAEVNYRVRLQVVCADNVRQIGSTINACCGQDELVVVCGGLGPTSDDKTREAVANAINQPLIHHADVWATIQQQLRKLGVRDDESNRQQALFPSGARTLSNPSGTAPGFYIAYAGSQIVVLPGPPTQALPMMDGFLSLTEKREAGKNKYDWMLIGISEGEVGSKVRELLPFTEWDIHFLWKSPYVLVQIETPPSQPMPQAMLNKLDEIFDAQLVSKNNKTAVNLLNDICDIRWTTPDAALSVLLLNEKDAAGSKPLLSAEVSVSPTLASVVTGDNLLGKMKMSVRLESGMIQTVDFPYNKTLLPQSIPEYAAWCVLNALAADNG